MEILFILFIAVIFFAVIAIVGHLIWVTVRVIVQWVFVPDVKVDDSSLFASNPRQDKLYDLDIAERQIVAFYGEGRLNDETYNAVMQQIRAERANLASPQPRTAKPEPQVPKKEAPVPVVTPPPAQAPPSVVTAALTAGDDEIVIEPVPTFIAPEDEPVVAPPPAYQQFTPPPRAPRRSFSEMLNSFMEESNIR